VTGVAGRGWTRWPATPGSRAWAAAARAIASGLIDEPARAHWWRHGGTWFAGVDALQTDGSGAIAGQDLPPEAMQGLLSAGGVCPLHPAQLSVVRPGYPQDDGRETPAATRYRRKRDGAHLDGLLPVGPDRRRMLKEPHAIILGIALTAVSEDTSPLIVWEGSHRKIPTLYRRDADAIQKVDFRDIDVTEAYARLRRDIFGTCPRRSVTARAGDMIWVHRHALHGIAPWGANGSGALGERMIAWFRPLLCDPQRWLHPD